MPSSLHSTIIASSGTCPELLSRAISPLLSFLFPASPAYHLIGNSRLGKGLFNAFPGRSFCR